MTPKDIKSPVEGAYYMLSKGFKVFPIRAGTKNKPIKGWQQWAMASSPAKVKEYMKTTIESNWGVFTGGSGLAVLDVDDKKGHEGSKTLKYFEADHGPLPQTLIVRTPTGGFHHYFVGHVANSAGALGDGLDFRGEGGYVVAPGSVVEVEEGPNLIPRSYDIINDVDHAFALPAWISESLTKIKKDKLVMPDEGQAEGSLSEGSRNNTLVQYAGLFRGQLGMDAKEILQHLRLVNQCRCDEPISDEELVAMSKEAAGWRKESALAHASFLMTADIKAMKDEGDWPKGMSQYKYGTAPEREWIVEDWIPKGVVTSLYGSGGSGKSLAILQLGLAIALGGDFLGWKLPDPRKMAFLGVFCEDSDEELHRRRDGILNDPKQRLKMHDMLKTEEGTAELDRRYQMWSRQGKDNSLVRATKDDIEAGPFMAKLVEWLRSHPKDVHKVISLDTLSDIYMGDENNREKVTKFIKYHLVALCIEYNCTIILVAHPSRAGQSSGDQLSGSTAWENSVRGRIVMTYDEETETVTFKLQKANYSKRGAKVEARWEAGRWVKVDGVTEVDYIAEKRDQLGCYLSKRMLPGEINSINDIIDSLLTDKSQSNTQLYTHICKLTKQASRRNVIRDLIAGNHCVYNGVLFKYCEIEGVRSGNHAIIAMELDKNNKVEVNEDTMFT